MSKPRKDARKLTLIPIGNSTGVILPKEMLASLRVGSGDRHALVETSDGLELRRYDPEFEKQMDVARNVMSGRKHARRTLAK